MNRETAKPNAANQPETPATNLDVLAVGDLYVDLIMSGFASWPSPGEELFAKKFQREIGGGASITACGLAKLGLKVGLLGLLGKDDGQWMLDQLRARNVGTSTITTTSAQPTGLTLSLSTSLDRAFLTYPGANLDLAAFLGDLSAITGKHSTRHIHLAHAINPELLRAACEAASTNKSTLSLDVGWHPQWFADPRAISALPCIHIFFPNEREAALITQESEPRRMLEKFHAMGLRRVALKLGKNGAALLWDDEFFTQRPGNTQSVDTTGAGDCFDAGFLYGWLSGMKPAQCLKAAVACGELSTRALGGIAGFPTKPELERILCTP
jgi:sugar/nucleoside kinase (ribokinase family)